MPLFLSELSSFFLFVDGIELFFSLAHVSEPVRRGNGPKKTNKFIAVHKKKQTGLSSDKKKRHLIPVLTLFWAKSLLELEPFLQNPSDLLTKLLFRSYRNHIALQRERLCVLSVRKATTLVLQRQQSLALHCATVWPS